MTFEQFIGRGAPAKAMRRFMHRGIDQFARDTAAIPDGDERRCRLAMLARHDQEVTKIKDSTMVKLYFRLRNRSFQEDYTTGELYIEADGIRMSMGPVDESGRSV